MTAIDIEKDINIHLENKKVSKVFFWFLWIVYAIVCMTKNAYSGSLAGIVSEGVLTKSQTGLITAMFYLVYTPLQIVGGIFADRYSPERMLKIGLIGACIANTIIFFNQNYYVMMITWVFNGIIQFGIWPSIFKIVSSQLVRSERREMSYYISFSVTAGVLLSYLLAAVVQKWQYNFLISAVCLIILALVLHIFERKLNPYMRFDKKEKMVDECENQKEKQDKMKIFIASGFFIMLFSMILVVTVSQSRTSLTSVMLMENYSSVSPSLSNSLTAVMIGAGLIGNLIAGRFIKKIKNEISFIITLSLIKIPILVFCTLVGLIPISLMVVLLSVMASLDAVTEIVKIYYTMHFTKYGLNGTAAGILNAGSALSYMIAAYFMPLFVENFGWNTLLVSLPIMIAFSILALLIINKRFSKFKSEGILK